LFSMIVRFFAALSFSPARNHNSDEKGGCGTSA
jgi:hypothetical protein